MNVKKIGHCCLLIRTARGTVLTDPGNFSTAQNELTGIDLVVITHEHADHLHAESLRAVLANNPQAKVVTNSSVGKRLAEMGIACEILEGTAEGEFAGIPLAACDGRHEEIFEETGQVQNTGYLIDGRLFYPGDSFRKPQREVDVLALPVAGPWCRIADAVRYALEVGPKKAFPVHDGGLIPERVGSSHAIPQKVLMERGIEFVPMTEGEERDF